MAIDMKTVLHVKPIADYNLHKSSWCAFWNKYTTVNRNTFYHHEDSGTYVQAAAFYFLETTLTISILCQIQSVHGYIIVYMIVM